MLKPFRRGSSQGIDCDAFASLVELGTAGILAGYDAAIIDYDLGQPTGIEIAANLSKFASIPLILVSSKDREPQGQVWPVSIKMFINKSRGYGFALE